MEKYLVIPEEELKTLQHVSRQGKGLPPQKTEYERLVELNTSLQNQLKQQEKAPIKPFRDKQQRVWDMLTAQFPSLGFNNAWEVTYEGDTWGGSNVFDLLKAACDEKYPPPMHMPRMLELIKEAHIPQSMLAMRKPQGALKPTKLAAAEDIADEYYETADEDLEGLVRIKRPEPPPPIRPIRIKRPPNRYDDLPLGRRPKYESYK